VFLEKEDRLSVGAFMLNWSFFDGIEGVFEMRGKKKRVSDSVRCANH
jgi:hypothetical protein